MPDQIRIYSTSACEKKETNSNSDIRTFDLLLYSIAYFPTLICSMDAIKLLVTNGNFFFRSDSDRERGQTKNNRREWWAIKSEPGKRDGWFLAHLCWKVSIQYRGSSRTIAIYSQTFEGWNTFGLEYIEKILKNFKRESKFLPPILYRRSWRSTSPTYSTTCSNV